MQENGKTVCYHLVHSEKRPISSPTGPFSEEVFASVNPPTKTGRPTGDRETLCLTYGPRSNASSILRWLPTLPATIYPSILRGPTFQDSIGSDDV